MTIIENPRFCWSFEESESKSTSELKYCKTFKERKWLRVGSIPTILEILSNIDKKNKNNNIKESWNEFRETCYCLEHSNLSGINYMNKYGDVIGLGMCTKNDSIVDLIIRKNGESTVLEYVDWNPPKFLIWTFENRKDADSPDFDKPIKWFEEANYKEIKNICFQKTKDCLY